MAPSERTVAEQTDELESDERAWLADRLKEYDEVLAYLREHSGVSAGALKRPSLRLVVAIDHATRMSDELFDEPDDLDRVTTGLGCGGSP